MQKIILYYRFVPISDPDAIRLWQQTLCEKLNLRGRIIIASHGINGTLGGNLADLKTYIKETKRYPAFKRLDCKWSDGNREHFPKLNVRVRPEIITFGVPEEIEVDEQGIVGSGQHLKPQQLHDLLDKRGGDVVLFDGRNLHESAVGRFKHAVVPAVTHSRDFPRELDEPEYQALKDKPVVTYCTGGIRCEVLSMLMKKRGFREVYQLEGGIQRYGEVYGDDGLWEGSLYVFDGRIGRKFSDRSRDIGHCVHCDQRTSTYKNCADTSCNALILVCGNCQDRQRCPACLNAAQPTERPAAPA